MYFEKSTFRAEAYWKKLSTMPYKKMKAFQNKLLRGFIRNQIYPFSPFYRRMFKKHKIDPYDIRTTDDLVKLPFTTKEDIVPTDEDTSKPKKIILQPTPELIKKHYPKGQLIGILFSSFFRKDRIKKRFEAEYKPIHLHFTAGRSAASVPFLYTHYDIVRLRRAGARLGEVCGMHADDIVINGFPYAPHLAFWQVFHGADHQGAMALQTGGGKILTTERIIKAIEAMNATALTFIPGYAYHLLRKAASQKRDFSSVKTVIFGGERVPPGLKDKVRELLVEMGSTDPTILATYASTEFRVAWAECPSPEPMGYHTYPDFEFIEIVDPKTGERVNDGETGEIVYTALDWRGSCVLRYRSGDVAKGGIIHEQCPYCGKTVPRINSDISRSSDHKKFNLTKVKGNLVDLNAFYPIMMGHPYIEEWQVEITKKDNDPYNLDELHLYVTPKKGVDFEALKSELAKQIQEEMMISLTSIQKCKLNDILDKLGMETELKEKRIIDKRNLV